MKRNERNTLNQLRKSITADTINVEIPETFTREGRQALHDMLTIEKHMHAVRINWNDFEKCYAIHYIPTNETTQEAHNAQEGADIDDVMQTLQRSDYTWNGYKKPDDDETTEETAQEETTTTDDTEKEEAPTMTRTTLKTIKTMAMEGIAMDITDIPDHFARNLKTNDNPECIMASSGVYGINGAILRGRETGRLYAITSRSSTLFYFA